MYEDIDPDSELPPLQLKFCVTQLAVTHLGKRDRCKALNGVDKPGQRRGAECC